MEMDASLAAAALLLGLAGGAHCVGMCGGIAGALAAAPGSRARPYAFTVAYHLGRAASYTAAGAIAGGFGEASLTLRGSLAIHQVLFMLASAAMLATGLYVAGYAPFVRRLEVVGALLWRQIRPWSRPLIPATTPLKAGALGVLWGWLPCGMVYGALLLALATGSVAKGAATMAVFALGTMPALVLVAFAARSVTRRPVRRTFRVLAGMAIAAVGLYGLVRLAAQLAAMSGLCTVPAGLLH